MDEYFKGKVALATGAAVGMGFEGAQAFADAGAAVVLSDVEEALGKGHRPNRPPESCANTIYLRAAAVQPQVRISTLTCR